MPSPFSSAAIATNALLTAPRPRCAVPVSSPPTKVSSTSTRPRSRFSARTDHGAPQLMHPDPGRLVAAEPQNLLQAHGAGTVLLAGHVPNGPKPHPQGLMRVLKDRSRSGRRLVTTTVADDPASRRRPTAAVLATRTKKSLRPPKLLQIRSTDLFRIESLLQFQDCPRIVLHARILVPHPVRDFRAFSHEGCEDAQCRELPPACENPRETDLPDAALDVGGGGVKGITMQLIVSFGVPFDGTLSCVAHPLVLADDKILQSGNSKPTRLYFDIARCKSPQGASQREY